MPFVLQCHGALGLPGPDRPLQPRERRVRRVSYLLLEYTLADDYLERRGPLREEHLGLARAAQERGELVLAGALADPADRSLLVWATEDRSVVTAFAEADPYVREGLVTDWTVRPWTVVIGGPAAGPSSR
jgi:uncharacterized protein YciI